MRTVACSYAVLPAIAAFTGSVPSQQPPVFATGTGQPPFEASSLADLAPRVAGAEPPLPSALRSDMPPAVERALLDRLDKDPARRPASVAELALALAPYASAASEGHAERATRILGATLPPRPRASLPTIGLGLNALSTTYAVEAFGRG